MAELATTLRTRSGQGVLVVEEVALRVATGEAERDPVTEGLAALLLDPVAFGLGHATVTVGEGRACPAPTNTPM